MGDDGSIQRSAFVTVVGAAATVVIGTDDPTLLIPVRAALTSTDPALAFVSVLTSRGPEHVPPFVFTSREAGGVRMLVRGGLRAVLGRGDGSSECLVATSMSTWHESVHPDVQHVEVQADDGVLLAVVALAALEVAEPSEVSPPQERHDPLNTGGETIAPSLVPIDERSWDPPVLGDEPVHSGPPTMDVPVVEEDEPFVEVEVEAALPPIGAEPISEEVDLSHLFETRHVGVEAAAVRSTEPDGSSGPEVITGVPSASPYEPASASGDHDGYTIAQPAVGAERPPVTAAPPVATPGAGEVHSVRCPSGHENPPHADGCRACGAAIEDRSIHLVPRPVLGHLDFTDGMVVDVDKPLLVGRRPTAAGHSGEPPGLVALPDPDGALSRLHLEVRIEGWEVLVVDRDSLNGTLVEVPGQDPIQLRPLDPFLLSDGTYLTLAGAVTCVFRTGIR